MGVPPATSASANGVAPRRIRVVVTCSDRKRIRIPTDLQLRSVPQATQDVRCEAWVERLQWMGISDVVAADLYCGDHWFVARSLPGMFAGLELWVASAGYGLIPASARIKPYAATFAPGHADSVVVREADSGARWWHSLGGWAGPVAGAPRSLAQLAAMDPKAPMLVVASAVYTGALASDILEARTALADREAVAVVSIGVPPSSGLYDLVIPADARLQAELGGARQSLNVRLARRLLDATNGLVCQGALRTAARELMEAAPPPPRYHRTPRTDYEVRRDIAAALRRAPGASYSKLLRRYRDQGFACEQQRFRALFNAVVGGRN